mmetsp:Transcript_34408/g.78436  ORF Transcript_34408/g.78436 Transcript_34408/m.78436 type:complete len:163 (+) Transcript_34408:98-586(+)
MPRGVLGLLQFEDQSQASIWPVQHGRARIARDSAVSFPATAAVPSKAVSASFFVGGPQTSTSFSSTPGHTGDEAKAHAVAAFSASSLSLVASMASFLTAYVHFSFDREDLEEEQKRHAEHLERVESSPRSNRQRTPLASAVQPTTIPVSPTHNSGGSADAAS